MVRRIFRRSHRDPAVGAEIATRARRGWLRSGGTEARLSKRPRWFVMTLGLGSVLLIAMTAGTADAQDLTGSWRKVRQACQVGELTCDIKAKFVVRNIGATDSPSSLLGIYLSDDAVLDTANDTLLEQIAVGPIAAGATASATTNVPLALGISASSSFIIAAIDDGNSVIETDETNNVVAFANPGPTGVVLFDRLFGPEDVTIPVGTRVRWMHREDAREHTVTSGTCDDAGDCVADGIFTSGIEPDTMNLFDEFIHVFNVVGTFPYFCEVHKDKMTGSINVVD